MTIHEELVTPLPRCVDGHCADGALLIGPPGVVLVLQPVQPLHEPLVRDEVGLEGRWRAIRSKCLVIVRLIETENSPAFGWLIIPILNYATRSQRCHFFAKSREPYKNIIRNFSVQDEPSGCSLELDFADIKILVAL